MPLITRADTTAPRPDDEISSLDVPKDTDVGDAETMPFGRYMVEIHVFSSFVK